MEVVNKDLINNSGVMNPSYNMPGMNQQDDKCMMKYQMVYPEIFYRLDRKSVV